MTILDDLLEFESDPSCSGKVIARVKSRNSFAQKAGLARPDEFEYVAHKTKAGLYVVLQHEVDGPPRFVEQFYRKNVEGLRIINRSRRPLLKTLPDGSSLVEVCQSSSKQEYEGGMTSVTKRSLWDAHPARISSNEFIIGYAFAQGKLDVLTLEDGTFRFEISRGADGGSCKVMYGVEAYAKHQMFDESSGRRRRKFVDPEATMENLIPVLRKPEFTDKEVLELGMGDYLKLK